MIKKIKNVIIITFIIILIVQAIMPIKVNASSTIFSKSISFQWKDSGNGYGVCVPTNASNYENIPVIVWLHGSGECGGGGNAVKAARISKSNSK